MSDAPVIAQKSPYPVELEAEEFNFWCSCGQSKKQPFCDGSHKCGSFAPVKFTAEASKTAYQCGCKHSGNGEFCDRAHKAL